jgi:hypothetical protein
MRSDVASTPNFREVIRPPLWLMAFVAIMLFSVVVAVWAAFTNSAAQWTAVGMALLLIYFYRANIHVIEVRDGWLSIDRAHIEVKYIDSVDVLPKMEFLRARSRDFDPAAYPALIYWISEGVRITINDVRDKTPYWLVSTKRGNDLSALLANRL